MKTLAQALLDIARPGNRTQIWAGEITAESTEWRFGDHQFDNGGVQDDYVLLGDGNWLSGLYASWLDFPEKDEFLAHLRTREEIANEFFWYLDEDGCFDEERETLSARGIFEIEQSDLIDAISGYGNVAESGDTPEIIVSAAVCSLIEKSEQFDDTNAAYAAWCNHYKGDYAAALRKANSLIAAKELGEVITAGEAVELYKLSESAVRQAISRGMPARKSGGTWLLRRSDAEARWGKK